MKTVRLAMRSSDTPDERANAIMALLAYEGDPADIAAIRGTIAETLKHYAELDQIARIDG